MMKEIEEIKKKEEQRRVDIQNQMRRRREAINKTHEF